MVKQVEDPLQNSCWRLIPTVEGRLNPTMVLRGGAFMKWLGIDKVFRIEPLWLNTGGFKRRRETARHIHVHVPHFLVWRPCVAVKQCQQGHQQLWLLNLGSLESLAKINLFSWNISLWYHVLSNTKQTKKLITA